MRTCGIFLINKATRKLLVCHATKASWKTWSIPKGHPDEGETSFQAACRELLEETGIDINTLQIQLCKELPPVKYKLQKKTLESFFMVTETDLSNFKFFCQSLTGEALPEIDAWKWINTDVAEKYLHESQLQHLNVIKEEIEIWGPNPGNTIS